MTNPVLVELGRGTIVESRHRGAIAVVDAAGSLLFAVGEYAAPVFPRSAVKPFQALPFLESGAFEASGLGEEALALACGSHSGEERHAALAGRMLEAAQLGETALELSPHWPLGEAASRALAQAGEQPRRLHNNCSGKHAAFLLLARHQGWTTRGYSQADHPVQRAVSASVERFTGAQHALAPCAHDGCTIPTWAIPLDALARGFARLAIDPAAERLRSAMAAHPWAVAGSGRFDSDALERAGERLIVKTGAEGVYGAAIVEAGIGIAIKIDDGTTRASVALVGALLERWLPGLGLDRLAAPDVTDWGGTPVGTTAVNLHGVLS